MKHSYAPLWLVTIILLAASLAQAIEPAELIDSQLQRQQVQFVNLAGGDLSFFDGERRLRRVPAEDFVSLRMISRTPAPATPGRPGTAAPGTPGNGVKSIFSADTEEAEPPARTLALNDGHVLTGSFGGVQDGKLLWVTPAFGVLPIELDNITRMTLTEPTPGTTAAVAAPPGGDALTPGAEAGADRIMLINGDMLAGFIESVNETGLKLDANGQKLDLPWDRVAQIMLPNPVNRTPGIWVRLADGTHFKLDRAVFDSQKLTGGVMGRDVEMPGEAVRSIHFATKHQLLHLAEMEPRLISGGQVFGVPMFPQSIPGPGAVPGAGAIPGGGEQLALHAPVTLEYTLPANARRFAADARLSDADLDWADLTLVVTDGKSDLFRQRLNADKPEATLNVPLKGSTLTLQLEEGVNGPIRDRLQLDRAVILVEIK